MLAPSPFASFRSRRRANLARALGRALLAVALTPTFGCAGPCAKVRNAQAQFDAAEGPAKAPDVAMWLPYDRLDRLIAPQIRDIQRFAVPLPELAGFALPRLEGMVESVRIRPARAGRVGFAVRVSLRSGGKRLLVVDLSAEVPPRVAADKETIEIDLAQAEVKDMRAKVDANGTRQLSAWLWSQLPDAVRSMTPRPVFDQAVADLSGELVSGLAGRLAGEVPTLFEEVAAIEIDLAGLPIAAVDLRSDPQALQLALRSDLPVARGLEDPYAKARKAEDIELRVAGESLTAFANLAMRTQRFDELPARYDERGEPDPNGPFTARAKWRRAARPLVLEVFSTDKDCAHVSLAATPTLRVDQGQLVVQTNDARLERVHAGGIKVRSAIFFGGVGRRSFAVAQELATDTEFDVGGQSLRARIVDASLDREGLRMQLQLGSARR